MPVSMGIVSEVGSVLEYYASTLDITIGVPTQVGKCQHGYNHMPDNSSAATPEGSTKVDGEYQFACLENAIQVRYYTFNSLWVDGVRRKFSTLRSTEPSLPQAQEGPFCLRTWGQAAGQGRTKEVTVANTESRGSSNSDRSYAALCGYREATKNVWH